MEPTIYKPSIYKGAGIYKTGAEGGGGFLKDSVKMGGITYKLFFFAGFVFSENLRWPVDIGVNTFAPNGDDNNIEEYGYLYTQPARNALRANINNLGAEWGKWAILSYSGQIKFLSDALGKYTLSEKIEKFKPQFAGLRRNSNYLAFGSSLCLGYGDEDGSYCDVTRTNFQTALSSPGGDALSVRMVLLKD